MKKANKINLVLLALTLSANGLYAQQGFGTEKPNKASVIDMSSTTKGMLIPRVALTSTTNFAPVTGIAAADQHTANSLLVYNTATAGDVTPGYYYWEKPTVAATGKWVRIATGADAKTEPWRIQNTANEATANTDNIYQEGKVAIGFTSANALTTKQMEVKGDFKSEITAAGGVVGTEVGSPLNPNGAMHYWSNGTDYRTASANDLSATLEAKTGTTTNTFAAGSTQAQMASQNGTNSLSTVRALNTGEFRLESYNVASNFGSTVSLQNDGLRLRHTNTNGALDPFPANNLTEILVRKAEGVQFNYQNAAGNSLSAYWFPITTGAAGQVMTQTATGKMVWTNPSTFGAANNGLTKNATTGVFELGGTLNRATTIATTISGTTYPLNITGLPIGDTNDYVMLNGFGTGQLKMIPASSFSNIYTANGSIVPAGGGTGTRTVTLNGNALHFVGANQTTQITNNSLVQKGTSNASAIVASSADANSNGRVTNLYMQAFDDNAAQIFAGEGATSLTIGTHVTAAPAPIIFTTTSTGGALSTEKMRLTPAGELAIGATSAPSFTVGAATVQPKLHIAGDVSTTGKYYTTNSVYADYVFEKYFKGSSEINPSYEFKSLNYVKDFIKANNHLPGVESINDLAKAENGYTFDMTKLTIQSLEKIEELYLHTIEQQEKIDQQQTEIEKLKKDSEDTKERLERLEEMLLKK